MVLFIGTEERCRIARGVAIAVIAAIRSRLGIIRMH